MLRLTAFCAGILGVVAVIVWGIQSYLVVDDLASCTTPDPLVAKCAPADAIVAISGGDTAARTQTAIELYRAGWAPKLVFSGAALDTSGPSNAAVMRKQALLAGVPDGAIITEETSTDTTQNASQTMALIKDARRIILVTSPYHQHRASLEFAHVFGSGVTIVNHPTSYDWQWPALWFLTPNGWILAIFECIKTAAVSLWAV